MTTSLKKVVAYIRVSTDHQDLSLEVQAMKLNAFCQFHSLVPMSIFSDEDVSGRKPLLERPGGRAMMKYLDENTDVCGVIALRVDRMFRNDIDGLTTADAWAARGIDFYATDIAGNSVNVRSSHGRLMFTLMLSFAVFESMRIGERTQDALTALKSAKKKYSHAPFGFYANEENGLVPHEGETVVLRKIINLTLDGYGNKRISDMLNEEGVQTKRDKVWHGSTVRNILANSIYNDLRQEVIAERKLGSSIRRVDRSQESELNLGGVLIPKEQYQES
jgi:site-specific DNA recombinase